ncbi:hypothetical protein [Kineococcus sp. NPDC059986]|uniref:hypothetical protein n=1 Tax=Kineococcus sp. NPDC059986 TaxID=3155538 RepID=UPI00344FF9BB
MISRENSRFIHAVPLPLPFRALGLDASFTGPRGLAMWNPIGAPTTTITLCHGEVDPSSPRPSVRVVTEPRDTAPGAGYADAVRTALLTLPGLADEDDDDIAVSLRGRSDITLLVDGTPTPFALHRSGSRYWVAAAALPDVEVAVTAHATAVEDIALVTLDADLSDYEAAPTIVPRLRDLADSRADLVLGWADPVGVLRWAQHARDAGVDVPALHRILAGDLSDADRLRCDYEQALDELGAPQLDVTQARWQVARSWAAAAVDGDLRPEEAARRIAVEVHDQLGWPDSLQPVVAAHREVERRGVVTGNLLAELIAGARAVLAS